MMKHYQLKIIPIILSFAMGEFVHAQLGISPSMNSQFLTELRARSPQRAEEGRDMLGADRQIFDQSRALSRPEFFSFSEQRNQRLEGDLTGFNSQYQMGRKYLSPFYHGVLALEGDTNDKSAFKSSFALQQTFEYNSAILYGKGGTIFSPMLLADVSYQISPNQSLSFQGGIGLSWISGNDHIDGSYFTDEFFLNVLPGTSLVYDLDLGALHVTAYDRVSVKPILGMLQNDLGIAGTVALTDQLSWTVNYTFAKTYDIDGDFSEYGKYNPEGEYSQNGQYPRGFNADIHSVSSELVFQNKGSWSAGLEGSLNWYRPEDAASGLSGQNDNSVLSGGSFVNPYISLQSIAAYDTFFASLGTFAQIMINKDTRLRVAAGYQQQSYDGFPKNFQQADTETSQPYYSLSLSQKINERTSHELSAGYETNLQRRFNNVTSHFVNYGLTRQIWKGGQLTGNAYFEHSDCIETPFAQNTTSYGLDVQFSQRLTEKLSASVAYSYNNLNFIAKTLNE